MIDFPKGYFEDEVRDGFYVNGLMKKCWAAQLEVLSDIATICKKHNIKWYADCGTLLGAVRHGGFIPWDDDMDICMFREDYEKFYKVAEKELKSIYSNYVLYDYHSDNYDEMIGRVDNAVGWELSDEHLAKFHGYPFRAGVDIFPLDYMCDNRAEEEDRMLVAQMIFTVARREDLATLNDEVVEYLDSIEEACNIHFDRYNNLKIQLLELGEKLFSLYKRKEATKAVLMIYWLFDESHVYPLELYEDSVMLPFETIEIPAPAMYNEVLKIEYGDYMKIVRTGSAHEYPYHEKYINAINNDMGDRSPFAKRIKAKDIGSVKRIPGEGNPREMVRSQAFKFTGLLSEAYDELCADIAEYKYEEAISLLEQCQDVAIQIGTYIEENQGEGFVTVKHFEDYCEYAYQLHEKLVNILDVGVKSDDGVSLLDEMDVLKNQTGIINESIENDINVRKEIVFLPYKASKWKYMESEWKKCKELPDTDVYVVPIPYYDKGAFGSFAGEYYEGDMFPENVGVIDYNIYDFEARQPDVIYIQNPYDDDNYTYSVNPFHYARNLKQYTDKLIYIPCFEEPEIVDGDERAYKAMDQYVISPGVVFADEVRVQSERIKEAYIKKLTDCFGETTRDMWEEKLVLKPSVYRNEMKIADDVSIPDEWKDVLVKSDGSTKKTILYNIGLSSFYEHGDKIIDKIRTSLEIFKDNSDVVLLLHASDSVKTTLEADSKKQKLCSEYVKLLEKYKSEGFGVYVEHSNIDKAIAIADAYYGDADRLVGSFRNQHKPVMIQNVAI